LTNCESMLFWMLSNYNVQKLARGQEQATE